QGPRLRRAAGRLRGGAVRPARVSRMTRTHMCGELRAAHVGQRVLLQGWVNRRRDLGGVVFVDLRDRAGLVQVVVEPDAGEAFEVASSLRSEYVVSIHGT